MPVAGQHRNGRWYHGSLLASPGAAVVSCATATLDATYPARASLAGTQAPDCTMVRGPRLDVITCTLAIIMGYLSPASPTAACCVLSVGCWPISGAPARLGVVPGGAGSLQARPVASPPAAGWQGKGPAASFVATARQNVFYRGEQIDVIDREAVGICWRQDTIRTPLHQGSEVVCQYLLGVDDERGVALASAGSSSCCRSCT